MRAATPLGETVSQGLNWAFGALLPTTAGPLQEAPSSAVENTRYSTPSADGVAITKRPARVGSAAICASRPSPAAWGTSVRFQVTPRSRVSAKTRQGQVAPGARLVTY